MENTVELTADMLVVTPVGITKIAALKEAVRVPKAHVVGASIDAGIRKGYVCPGQLFRAIGRGLFVKQAKRRFLTLNKQVNQL